MCLCNIPWAEYHARDASLRKDGSVAEVIHAGRFMLAENAQKLQDQNALKTAAEALRGQLEHAQEPYRAVAFAGAYAAVVQKLQDQNAIKIAADGLRGQLEHAQDPDIAAALARAYAAVASHWLEIHPSDREREMQISRCILAMAGQPFLRDPTALLAALEPLTGRKFDDETTAAVAWWTDQYKTEAAALRPPLPNPQ